MKLILISFIRFYHSFLSPLLWQALGIKALCRYNQSCSVYTIEAIKKHGAVKGSLLGLRRLSTCHPFTRPTITHV